MTKRLLILSNLALASFAGVAMAAAGKTGGNPPPPPPPPAPTFAYDFDFDIPESRAVGKRNTELSDEQKAIHGMPAPNAEGKKASYLIKVTVPETVVGDEARVEAFKAETRKITNRVSGIIRRHRKDDANKAKNFSVRTVMDDKLGFGVRIWRDADTVEAAA